jgi:hypothetical protein
MAATVMTNFNLGRTFKHCTRAHSTLIPAARSFIPHSLIHFANQPKRLERNKLSLSLIKQKMVVGLSNTYLFCSLLDRTTFLAYHRQAADLREGPAPDRQTAGKYSPLARHPWSSLFVLCV